jgi:hypothetical protein
MLIRMNLASSWLLIGGLAIAVIPPLTDDQSSRLNSAVDGADYHDEAFLALVENARSWTDGLGDSSIRIHPDYRAMQDNPARHRGELCQVHGMLQQNTRLSPPFDSVFEWFIRTDGDNAMIVYVIDVADPLQFKMFEAVEIDARFYKRMEFIARDGQKHNYAALVGRFPKRASDSIAPASMISPLSVIAGLVAIMGIVFVGLMMWAKKSGGGRHNRPHVRAHRTIPAAAPTAVDDQALLPDDPAQALAELKCRAEQTDLKSEA